MYVCVGVGACACVHARVLHPRSSLEVPCTPRYMTNKGWPLGKS